MAVFRALGLYSPQIEKFSRVCGVSFPIARQPQRAARGGFLLSSGINTHSLDIGIDIYHIGLHNLDIGIANMCIFLGNILPIKTY